MTILGFRPILPFVLSIMCLVLGCGPQKEITLDPVAEQPPLEEATLEHSWENVPAQETETATQQKEPPVQTQDLPAEDLPERQIDVPEQELTPPPDPRELLETALAAYQVAQQEWREGNIENAIAELDVAYHAIISVDAEVHPDLLQEKEDLRYLISKRVVEVYASQRTAVGDTSRSIPLVMNEYVERELKSFQGRERKEFLAAYKRSGRYRPMIVQKLREKGLPEQLSWLPLIESWFKTNALSRARALGMWQFISSTGYRYGLSRDQWVDERMDPVKSTDAAIAYLVDLHNLFGDWMSALAGYNSGEGRVLRAIKSQHINYLDNFWDLYEMLPRETARYVPRFLATLIILEDPGKYGMELPEVDPPMSLETITVSRAVSLSAIDEKAGLSKETMRWLNPELRFKVTPDETYALRVPSASRESISEIIASLPEWEMPADTYMTHVVRRGDTLSRIASRYRTTTREIVIANRLRNQHRIWPGQKLKVPGRGAAPVARNRNTSRSAPVTSSGEATVHTVVAGDSLWRIAKRYGVTINQLKRWNNLSGNLLNRGQKLSIEKGGTVDTEVYRVRRGDTLGTIARRHGVSLNALLQANNLSRRDRIYPDQVLKLPK